MKTSQKTRRLVYALITFVMSLGILEVLARLTVVPIMGPEYTFAGCILEQEGIAIAGKGKSSAREVLHPYFGWTYDPDTDPGERLEERIVPVNAFGFVDDNTSLVTDEEATTIAVLGGSFAQEFVLSSEKLLVETLQQDSSFQGKKIEVVCLALPGFKQPQSLMVLNYMLAIGAQFDYVINLDGFNETVLPATDNVKSGIDIAHPRGWNARLMDVVDPQRTSISYRHHVIRAKRQMLAQNMLKSWLRWSYLRQVFWKIRDNTLHQTQMGLAEELVYCIDGAHRQFAVSGPRRNFSDENKLREELVELWYRCSLQMEAICEINEAKYLHCLQPNQYLPQSKPLSQFEMDKTYVNEDHPIRQAVIKGYPLFREYGQRLSTTGLQFCDLTQIYSKENQTIYKDWCCHVNQTGYDLVAKAIAQEILLRW